jgi:hypothetical protein
MRGGMCASLVGGCMVRRVQHPNPTCRAALARPHSSSPPASPSPDPALLVRRSVKSDQHLAAVQVVATELEARRGILLRLEGDDAVTTRAAIIPGLDLGSLDVVLREDLRAGCEAQREGEIDEKRIRVVAWLRAVERGEKECQLRAKGKRLTSLSCCEVVDHGKLPTKRAVPLVASSAGASSGGRARLPRLARPPRPLPLPPPLLPSAAAPPGGGKPPASPVSRSSRMKIFRPISSLSL